MDDLGVHVRVGALASWPDEQVERVYGLMTRSAARRVEDGDEGSSAQVVDLHAGAAQFGMELVRRGLI